jgi:hypothetical protein
LDLPVIPFAGIKADQFKGGRGALVDYGKIIDIGADQ